jgi:hypothetical protein
MDRAGVLEHRIVSDEEIAAAIDTPPAAARGRVRGKEIQRLSSSQRRGACDWNRIVDISGSKVIDLSDPFQGDSPQWKKIEREDALADLAHDFFAAPPFMRERHRSRSQADSLYRVVRGRDT